MMGIKQIFQNVAGLLAPFTTQRVLPSALTHKEPAGTPALASGFSTLDKALEIGGLPYGKIVELMGPGQTTLDGGTLCIAARIAAKVQRRQGLVTIIDLNHKFDAWQAERCGLTAPHLFLTQPDTVLTALTTLERAAQETDFVILLLGNLVDLLGDVEPNLLTTLLHRLHHIAGQAEGVLLFVTTAFGDNPFAPENYPSGFPLADIAAVRLWVQEESWTRQSGLTTAYKANLTVIKNELAAAGKGANIRIKLNSF